ncbi:MAG: hypothetical protein M5U19_12975 [Microthrixaceae bacterium]|nr:hypothetical protein [Microthrixaceae bacterium]
MGPLSGLMGMMPGVPRRCVTSRSRITTSHASRASSTR